jgi:hypothetical protein
MKENDNVYCKKGNRYVPFGMKCNEHYLPDGIWYVRHSDSSYGVTNVDHYLTGLYKVGESPEPIDIPRLCSTHCYVEYVMNSPEFKELMDKGSYSFQELTSKIVALVLKLNKTIKAKANDDNKRTQRPSDSF